MLTDSDCTPIVQNYFAVGGDDVNISFTHYSQCYKEIWAEIATILEAQVVITNNYRQTVAALKQNIDDLRQNVDQIKSDINVLRTRAETPNQGVVITGGHWYSDCDGNNSYRLENALAMIALKESELYQKFLDELNNPTPLPGDSDYVV